MSSIKLSKITKTGMVCGLLQWFAVVCAVSNHHKKITIYTTHLLSKNLASGSRAKSSYEFKQVEKKLMGKKCEAHKSLVLLLSRFAFFRVTSLGSHWLNRVSLDPPLLVAVERRLERFPLLMLGCCWLSKINLELRVLIASQVHPVMQSSTI